MANEVVQSFITNTLLTLGVSPVMAIEPEEAGWFAAITSALLVNAGTLTRERVTAMRTAIEQAHHAKTPWMPDPVAVGTLELHRRFHLGSLSLQPAAIHGNALEILALAGMNGGGCDMGTTDTTVAALLASQALARQIGTTVVATGRVDYVTDGQHTVRVGSGDPLMTCMVSTRYALSVVIATNCALRGDRLDSAASACSWVKQAGQIAARQSNGPGDFVSAFLDALYNLNAQEQA